jgi:hypothetical protein
VAHWITEVVMAGVLTLGVVATIFYPFAVTAVPAASGHSSYIPILKAGIVGVPGIVPSALSAVLAAIAAILLGAAAVSWAVAAVALALRRPAGRPMAVATGLTVAAFAMGFTLTNVWRDVAPWLPAAMEPTGAVTSMNFDILAYMFVLFCTGCAILWTLHLARTAPPALGVTWRAYFTMVGAVQAASSLISGCYAASLPVAGGPRSGRTGWHLVAAWLSDGFAGVLGAATLVLTAGVVALAVWTIRRTVRDGIAMWPALATALATVLAQGAFFLFLWQVARSSEPASGAAAAGAFEPSVGFVIDNLIASLCLVLTVLLSRRWLSGRQSAV